MSGRKNDNDNENDEDDDGHRFAAIISPWLRVQLAASFVTHPGTRARCFRGISDRWSFSNPFTTIFVVVSLALLLTFVLDFSGYATVCQVE